MTDTREEHTREQAHFIRTTFLNRIAYANGQAFQDLFVDIMTRRYPDFRTIKPQGIRGDQGNDGFIPETGDYFQVYAPENPTERVAKAAKKARDDFHKLKENWENDYPIVNYHFAFNDKYKGAFPDVEHALSDLRKNKDNGLTAAKPFLAKDLEREFWQLPMTEKEAVLGAVVPHAQFIDDIDFAALTEILQHLVDNQIPISDNVPPKVPDYDRKLKFNNIEQATHWLAIGNYQNAAVDIFFDRHGEFARTDIRNRLASTYASTKSKVGEIASDTTIGDRIYFQVLHYIAPKADKQVQDAAMVLISYFFEKCDVFEDPNG